MILAPIDPMCIQKQNNSEPASFQCTPTTTTTTITTHNVTTPAWMKGSIATQTSRNISAEVTRLTSNCRFLQQKKKENNNDFHNTNRIGVFRIHEIEVGELVGRGAFSEVLEIRCIRLLEESSSALENTSSSNDTITSQEDQQQHLREELRDSCLDAFSGRGRFVLKRLKDSLASNPYMYQNAAADLIVESMFLSNLNHPNIIKLRGIASHGVANFASDETDALGGGGYFFIMNRVDETLSQRIKKWQKERCYIEGKRRLAHFSTKIDFAYQIASALEYLHDHDIMFRDVKPDNIGIIKSHNNKICDRIQLFDFGLCRELPAESTKQKEEAVFEMSGVGTRRYMAPEVILKFGYNRKIDVYSWAMVFYEMLDLQKPFDMYNREAHRMVVCEGGLRPVIRQYWPLCIRELLTQAWEQDPVQRLSIKEVCNRLQPLVEMAERAKLTPSERSMRIIFEMAELFEVKTARTHKKRRSNGSSDSTSVTAVSLMSCTS